MPRRIHHLRITLLDVEPPVWRLVQVPGAYTLDRVSRLIQLSLGWRGYHLHSFEIGDRQYGEPDPLGALDLADELEVRLDAVTGAGDRFGYVYDFGDWWEHDVRVEAVTEAEPDEVYPRCVSGERAGPPEDIGGAAGYADALAVLADHRLPDPAGVREWMAGFDPERFEPEPVDVLLRRMV